MDPLEALKKAKRHIDAKEYQSALDSLVDYAQWRSGGGFEPDIPNTTADFEAASLFFSICRSQTPWRQS